MSKQITDRIQALEEAVARLTERLDRQALPQFLTIQDLADLLRTTPKSIKQLRYRGQLPPAENLAHKRVLWRADVVSEWLRRLQQSQQAQRR